MAQKCRISQVREIGGAAWLGAVAANHQHRFDEHKHRSGAVHEQPQPYRSSSGAAALHAAACWPGRRCAQDTSVWTRLEPPRPLPSLGHHPSVSRAPCARSLRISNAWRILTSCVAAHAFLQTFTNSGSRWRSSRFNLSTSSWIACQIVRSGMFQYGEAPGCWSLSIMALLLSSGGSSLKSLMNSSQAVFFVSLLRADASFRTQ